MSTDMRPIGVVPFGDVPEIVLKVITVHISTLLNLPSQILPPLDLPAYAFDAKRYQYDAGIIIDALESMPFKNYEKVVGVLDLDLFIPIFTHVFGEAKQGGKVALVSLFRLGKNADGSSPPEALVHERAVKVALHELGHLFELWHCEHKRCLMHFSGCIEELDEQPLYLCNYCSIYFQDKLNPD
jgi:archaemetzincin